ncbi:MAG TPA: hypothetical protein VG796_07040 [Verrucomicrobiales bacterium]|nr:hypothetical protein [Verrucomicrobiales bacterium]
MNWKISSFCAAALLISPVGTRAALTLSASATFDLGNIKVSLPSNSTLVELTPGPAELHLNSSVSLNIVPGVMDVAHESTSNVSFTYSFMILPDDPADMNKAIVLGFEFDMSGSSGGSPNPHIPGVTIDAWAFSTVMLSSNAPFGDFDVFKSRNTQYAFSDSGSFESPDFAGSTVNGGFTAGYGWRYSLLVTAQTGATVWYDPEEASLPESGGGLEFALALCTLGFAGRFLKRKTYAQGCA